MRKPRGRTSPRDVPANIALPFPFSSRRVGEVPRAGPYAAFLGSQFNPGLDRLRRPGDEGVDEDAARHDVHGQRSVHRLQHGCAFRRPLGHEPAGRAHARSAQRPAQPAWSSSRRRVRASKDAASGQQLDRYQQMAFSLLQSDTLRTALDLRREPIATREMYGHTLFGQSCLAARRLVEAGSRVVTVFWDEFGLAGMAWDTHWNHYPRMKVELCPGFDQGWYGLITDLDQRGLLDDTLVVCTSEHGRTPQINKAQGGGRDHWSRVYSAMMAGGGMARGRVVGASDKHGSDVTDLPLSPKDLLATMYHLLGIDHHLLVHDALQPPAAAGRGARDRRSTRLIVCGADILVCQEPVAGRQECLPHGGAHHVSRRQSLPHVCQR